MSTNLPRPTWRQLMDSVWVYPLVLTLILLLLTIFKISGTSIGMYHQYFYGGTKSDPALLYGQPRGIRSDEWLVTTQLTIAQAEADYPRINENFGTGMDMSVIADVPYKGWSVVFKPQNLSFLILPLEYAFAFKWWLLLYLLLVSSYFFALRLLPGKRLLSSLVSVGIGLSPFVFWWYVTGTLATLFYGFFILLLGMRIFDQQPLGKLKTYQTNILYAGLLVYLLTCFALVMYPPFQIPVALGIAVFLGGYAIDKYARKTLNFRDLLKRSMIALAGAAIAATLVLIFVFTRLEAFQAVTNTVYPGERQVASGGADPLHVFNGFLMPQLAIEGRGLNFLGNQSEASNFLLFLPFLLLPGFLILYQGYKKSRHIDWLLLGLQVIGILFFLRMFVPFGDQFYKLLFWGQIPHGRLLLGIGFVSFLHTLVLMNRLGQYKLGSRKWSALYSLLCFALLLWLGSSVAKSYPDFIQNPLKIALLAAVFSVVIWLILARKFLFAAGLIAAFSFISVFRIHPLYKGLEIATDNRIVKSIQANSSPEDTWVGADLIILENFGLISNRDSISGIRIYPDTALWDEVAGKSNEEIYNRYAHVLFSSDQSLDRPLRLSQPDAFVVKLDCSESLNRVVEFALTTQTLGLPCARLVDTVSYPTATFRLYAID